MQDGEAEDTQAGGTDISAALLHDLRTPLAAMRTAAEIVAREALSPTQKDALSTLTEAVDALLAMTAGLMKIAPAAISSRTNNASRSNGPDGPFNPAAPEIRSLTELFGFIARAKSIGFSLQLDEALEGLGIANPVALRRILSVLLDNAIKYTQAGSVAVTATIDTEGKDPALLLEVADTGCGISEEDRDGLFQAYRRASPAREDGNIQPDGTGLGLWNARRLASAMGGTLELIATSQTGSCFRLRLPIGPSIDRQAPPAATQVENVPAGIGTANEPLRFLVVDDNATTRKLLGTMLAAFGFEPLPAASGREALDLFAAQPSDAPIDAVLVDLTMPEMSGEATAEALRMLPGGERIPILAMSAAVNPQDGIRRKETFTTVLAKPITPASLYEAVIEAAANHPD